MIAQKENDDLFFIDTLGKDAAVNSILKKTTVKKSLKIDQILKPVSAYTIGRTHQPRGSKSEEALIVKKSKTVGDQASKPAVSKRNSAALYDAWGDDEVSPVVSKKTSKFVPVIPAVQVPSAATSYNPQPEEHLAHLESLESQELARLARNEAFKERLPSNEVSSQVVASADLVAVANRKLALGELSDNEDDLLDSESCLGGSTQSYRKKTIQDRKRQLRHKESLLEARKRRQEKKLHASIEQTPDLLAQIKNVQQTRQEADTLLAPVAVEFRHQRQINRIQKRLVLEPLSIKLPEELPSSMRQLAPEGNLVTDRFRSLIERGIVEATTHKILSTEVKSNNRKQGKSIKPRIKMVEKFSYKDFK